MGQEAAFSRALEEICSLARRQGNRIAKQQITEQFDMAQIAMGEKHLSMVYEYLASKHIGVGESREALEELSEEEADYLEDYLQSLEGFGETSEGEIEAVILSAMAQDPDAKRRMIALFLPRVAEIAKLYAGQGVFLEDLIGEGNLALTMAVEMLDCAENVMQAEGTVASMIMEAMETYIQENAQEKNTGRKLAGKANAVLDRAKEMAEALGRKVTVRELADETGMTMGQILEAVRITANSIEFLDTKETV